MATKESDKVQKGSRPDQFIMDVPLFVPEQFTLKFQIADEEDKDKRMYEFQWSEANVEEMIAIIYDRQMRETELRMVAEEEAKKSKRDIERFFTPAKEADLMRDHIYQFLKNHIVEGPPDKLKRDMRQIPLVSNREGIDLQTISDFLNRRIKKNGLDMGPRKGWFATRCSVLHTEDGIPYEIEQRGFKPRCYFKNVLAVIRTILRFIHMDSKGTIRGRD